MSRLDLVMPVASATTVASVVLTLRYASDAVLRLLAGITAIFARDEKRTRAERALDVLRFSGPNNQPPPD
jgi:hypothetical protein